MKKLKKDLQSVTKEFKTLTKKIGQLTTKLTKTAVDELEHAQTAIKLKSPAQHAGGALKALAKKTDNLIKAVDKFEKRKAAAKRKVKARPAKKARPSKAAAKRPRAKKTKTLTATDQVLKTIKKSRKGADVPTVVRKTGFDDKKVRNIINRLLKQGKIKRVARGVYAGV
jgi:hypothetical protein